LGSGSKKYGVGEENNFFEILLFLDFAVIGFL